jgi:beta propeller repeat protein
MPRFIVVVLLLAGALVLVAPAAASPPYASSSPIATGPATQDAPSLSLYGDALAWEEGIGGSWNVLWAPPVGPGDGTAPSGSLKRHPAFWTRTYFDTLIVWEDDRNGTWDLYCTTVPGSQGEPLPATALATGAGDQLDPSLSGHTVAYESNASGNWDICVAGISSATERRLTTDSADQVDPDIDGNIVAWADRRSGNWDIYCCDLNTGVVRRLTTSKAAQTAPSVGHGLVAYQDDRNGNWDIYAYDLDKGKERRLTSDRRDQTAPAIGVGRTVVYEDSRNGGDIFLCDLQSGVQKPVTDEPSTQTQPSVGGDHIAWADMRNGDMDIYGCTLRYPNLGFSASSSTPKYGSTVTFSGTLSFGSDGPPAAWVLLKGPGLSRSVKAYAKEGDELRFSFRLAHATRKLTLSASYRGDANYLPATTSSATIKPFASLSRPKLKYIPAKFGRLITLPLADVSGVLKPQHKSGTHAVAIEVWGRDLINGPAWHRLRTVKVAVHNQSGASYYSAKSVQSLQIGWHYRFRAVHSDADHTRTESQFSPVIRAH